MKKLSWKLKQDPSILNYASVEHETVNDRDNHLAMDNELVWYEEVFCGLPRINRSPEIRAVQALTLRTRRTDPLSGMYLIHSPKIVRPPYAGKPHVCAWKVQ